MLKYTTKQSIEMCKKSKHEKNVLYDKYIYHGSHIKSIFICPKHGEFSMTPHNFLKGKGCKLCAYEKKSNQKINNFDIIIKKCNQIHQKKYKYNCLITKNGRTYIKYICPFHGEQEQLLSNHLNGKGCKLCGNNIRNKKNKLDKIIAIKNLINKVGDKIDFSKFNYNGCNVKSICICKICGNEFKNYYDSLMHGNGCPICGKKKNIESKTLSLNEISEKGHKTHKNQYDYIETKKQNGKTYIHCYCHKKNKNGIEHGDFWQNLDNHLNKHANCPICNMSHMENDIYVSLTALNINFIYQYSLPENKLYKYDFYLSDYNILIECQGEQHFGKVNFKGAFTESKLNENLINQIKRDKYKYDLAITNKYQIIYYVDKSNFSKKINTHDMWYGDKEIYENIIDLINAITKKIPPYNIL